MCYCFNSERLIAFIMEYLVPCRNVLSEMFLEITVSFTEWSGSHHIQQIQMYPIFIDIGLFLLFLQGFPAIFTVVVILGFPVNPMQV